MALRFQRMVAAPLFAALIACSGAPSVEGLEPSGVLGQLRAQASGMTLWSSPRAELTFANGAPELRVKARTSKNLAEARIAGAVGQARILSARRFEVVLVGQAEIDAYLSGAPVSLVLEASEGRIRSYHARLELEPMLGSFSGDRRLWIDSRIAPSIAPGGLDALQYRSRFSVPRGVDPSSVTVTHANLGAAPITTEGARYRMDLSREQLARIYAAPSEALVFQARLGGASFSKEARFEVAIEGLALTTADAPFVPEACDADVEACLTDGPADPNDCGTYRQIQLCRTPVAPTCEPSLEFAITDCVYRIVEEFSLDPDRGPITDLEALDYCTQEGDLTGPMFDEICGAAPGTEFCACRGEETCFEAFSTDFVAPCAGTLRPRFDCALGRNFLELRSPRQNLFVVSRRTLGIADVADSLLVEQILIAARQSASADVATLVEAFDRFDENQVNVLDLWEGSNDRPYTVVEYGAGDNSYGAVFAYGTTTLAARIQDGDLYDASTPANVGCRIPEGPGWRRCESDEGCAAGLRCYGAVGRYDDTTGDLLGIDAPGKCVARPTESPRADTDCSPASPCPLEDNLACTSIASSGDGFCRPMWMFGRFRLPAQMPLPNRGMAEHPLMVSGLATVPEEAVFEATINSGNFARLRLSLANPTYRTTNVIFDGPALGTAGVRAMFGMTSGEVRVRLPVPVPGDESINGEWLLLIDTTRGAGTAAPGALDVIYGDPTVTFSSRWD